MTTTTDNRQLKRIESELNAANIPTVVWIGTDSTADRVTWLITRNELNHRNSRSRHKTIEALSEVVEAALQSITDAHWQEQAEHALILAGRRQP
jgi:hypothetical protein